MQSLAALLAWAGMDQETQESWAGLLGFQPDKLASLPQEVLRPAMAVQYSEAIATWKVGDGTASFAQKAAATLAFEKATTTTTRRASTRSGSRAKAKAKEAREEKAKENATTVDRPGISRESAPTHTRAKAKATDS